MIRTAIRTFRSSRPAATGCFFPSRPAIFLRTLVKQLWVPNLFRYMMIRAKYNAIPSDKNPYLKKNWRPDKTMVRVGILYMLGLIAALTGLVWHGDPLLLAVVPTAMWLAMMIFCSVVPERMYHQSRVHPVISMRTMSLLRISYITVLFSSLAWLSLYVTPFAALFYVLLWLVPIFTSFSFFMILRQLVQHGNGDRGWLTNTRIFFVNPLINFAVFPMGQDLPFAAPSVRQRAALSAAAASQGVAAVCRLPGPGHRGGRILLAARTTAGQADGAGRAGARLPSSGENGVHR